MTQHYPSDDLAALAQYWCILPPHTAVDTRTGLRFDARTATLMHTPEFLDWHEQRSRSHARNELSEVTTLGKLLEREIKACEGELRALMDAGLLTYRQT